MNWIDQQEKNLVQTGSIIPGRENYRRPTRLEQYEEQKNNASNASHCWTKQSQP